MPPENMAVSTRSGEDQPNLQPDLRIGKGTGGEHGEAVQAVLDEHRRVFELLRLDARDREERLNAALAETKGKADVAQAALERADSQTRWLQDELSESLSIGERVHEQSALIRQERDEARALAERRMADILRLEARFASLELQTANERAAASHEIARTSRDLAGAQALVLELRRELDSMARERADADAKLAVATAMTRSREAELARARAAVEVAINEAPGVWGSLLRAVGLDRQTQGRKALLSWLRTSSAVQANLNQGMAMGDFTPSLEREGRNPYLRANDLEDLLAWHDVSFVRCAYVTILGRQPDIHGEKFYTDKLRQGRSKLEILGQLRHSKEAARHDPGIAGLDRAIRAAARRRWPVLGLAFRLFSHDPEAEFASEIALVGDHSAPPAREYRLAIEARLAAIEQQVAEHARRLEELGGAPPQVAPHSVQEAATDHLLAHLRPTSPLAQMNRKSGF